MRLKSLFTLLSLVLVALLIWWYQLDDQRAANFLSGEDEHFIDAYMRDFILTAMSRNGTPDYTLSAYELNHYNDSDVSNLTRPVLHIIQANYHWELSAEHGEISDDYNEIVLQGNVVMQQIAPGDETVTGIRLLTEQIDINTEEQLASTELPVNIEYRQIRMQSRGMRLDSRRGRLELLAEVAGTYAYP